MVDGLQLKELILKDGESVDDAMKRTKRAMGNNSKKKSSVHKKQADWEEKHRNEPLEHGAYFDDEGNMVFEEHGTSEGLYNVRYLADKYPDNDEYWEKVLEYNRNVEQQIWADKRLHYTHNHPLNTIFSDADINTFEELENASMSATLPNGTTYRLVRMQPRTSNEWVQNPTTGEFERKFTPLKIAPHYAKAYSDIYDKEYEEIRNTTAYGSNERKQREEELDRKTAEYLENWLTKNAHKYGYKFIKE